MKETIEQMKVATHRLRRGTYSISECERKLDALIDDVTNTIEDIDERVAAERNLKRKAWRLLLEATK